MFNPPPVNGQYYRCTLNDQLTGQVYEVVLVTAVVGDTITMIRGQEGTTAQNWLAGDFFLNNPTSGTAFTFAQVVIHAGNPNGFVAGTAASGTSGPTLCWDDVNSLFYACTTTGSAGTAVWAPIANAQLTLSASISYYVSPTGNDSNPGTSALPWLTLSHAASVIQKINTNGYAITVNVAPGTYGAGFVLSGILGGGSVTLLATNGTPTNTLISTSSSPCVALSGSGTIAVENFQLEATGVSGPVRNGLLVSGGGNIIPVNLDFSSCADGHMSATGGGTISAEGQSWNISNTAAYHVSGNTAGQVNIDGANISVSGAPNFGVGFAYANNAGHIDGVVNSYSGTYASVTGPRYFASNGGSIYTGGGGANWFPGSSPGNATTGYYT